MAELGQAGLTPTNEPINKSSDYLAMQDYWSLVTTILGGAEAMRAAGEKYLTRFQNEVITNDAQGVRYDPYAKRLAMAPFTNIYEDSSKNLAAKPFSKEMKVVEDADDWYKQLSDNIDQCGNNLHVFCQDVFQTGIDYGITWIMVDYSRAQPRADGGILSLTDEKVQGLRPYWIHIEPYRLLAVYSDFVNGEEIIIHARIDEPTTIVAGYIETTVQRVRVLHREPTSWDAVGKALTYGPAAWYLYELVTTSQGTVTTGTNASTWRLVGAGVYSLGYIPLIPFVTGKRIAPSFTVRPPLRGLAWLQVEEYNQESNLKTVMELTCFPMLSGDGINPPEDGLKVPIGPRAVLYGGSNVEGKIGTWKFLEPSATSIKELQTKLEKTQNDMRDLSYQPLTLQNLTVITTGQVAVKANSAVQAWAIRFRDVIEQAFVVTANWVGRSDAPDVYVHTDFNVGLLDTAGFAQLMAMRANKDISREAIVNAAVRYGYLDDNFDPDADEQALAEEQANNQLQAEQTINPITGQPLAIPSGKRLPPTGANGRTLPPGAVAG